MISYKGAVGSDGQRSSRVPFDFASTARSTARRDRRGRQGRQSWMERRTGNPGRDDTGVSGPRFSAAPTALPSSSGLSPALPGWADVLASGPPGLASVAIFAVSILSQLAIGKPTAPTAHRGRRDDNGEGGDFY
jgi:hypothetical protein